jgi:hypothetical protein
LPEVLHGDEHCWVESLKHSRLFGEVMLSSIRASHPTVTSVARSLTSLPRTAER